MKLQEFCVHLLSFPWLAKLAEWKFHCSESYKTSYFPLITLPGGTFAPTTTRTTQTPPTFAPTPTTLNTPTFVPTLPTPTTTSVSRTVSSTLKLPITSSTILQLSTLTSTNIPDSTTLTDLTTTQFSSQVPDTSTSVSNFPINSNPPPSITTTEPFSTTQEFSTVQISSTTQLPSTTEMVSTTDETLSTFTISPPILTTTELTITTTEPFSTTQEFSTVQISSTTQLPSTTEMVSTTEETLSTFTISPQTLTTTEFVVLSTTSESYSSTDPFNDSNLTTASVEIPTSTESFTYPELTTTQPFFDLSTTSVSFESSTSNVIILTTVDPIIFTVTLLPPVITTTVFSSSTSESTVSSTVSFTSPNLTTVTVFYNLTTEVSTASSEVPFSTAPKITTTSSPIDITSTSPSASDSTLSFTQPDFTSLEPSTQDPLTTISFTNIPSTLPSTTVSTPPITTSTSLSATTVCPPFPEICPPNIPFPTGTPNFGDNAIDPRSTYLRQLLVTGCPCIDIRIALTELLMRGTLPTQAQLQNRLDEMTQDCKSPSGESGNCINFRFCNQIVNLIIQTQQKRDEVIETYIRNSICGYDGADQKVCCPSLVFGAPGTTAGAATTSQPGPFIFSSVSTPPTTAPQSQTQGAPTFSPIPTTPLVPTNPANPTNAPGSIIFSSLGTTVPPPIAPPGQIINRLPTNEADRCGVTVAIRTRIVGGSTAPRGAYPWLAALGYRTPNIRFLCGGTLITQKHVLSAAHCILDTLAVIRLGAHEISSTTDGSVDYNIESKSSHENYDAKYIVNDISIIKLVGIVNITNFIRPICIPFSDALANRDYTGTTPWVAGWGSVSFRGPGAAILQEVQLPVVSQAECEFNYRLYFPNQVFDNRVLCAGYAQGGKDSCQGDSGGGLVLPVLSSDGTSSYYIFIGIVSYGFECARPNFPGIYTRIAPTFLPWIQKKINE